MTKPPGVGIRIREGAISIGVATSSRAEDLIYDAVKEAQRENMTPTLFVRIARSAWSTTREEQATDEDKEFQNLQK